MYEEEDDDLPMQYRRLTAHLQTQNADFDRRLAAYLTNHVAMRSALGQAVSDAWQNNQFNNIGQFMNPGMMQQPLQQQQQQPGMPNSMLPPQMPNRSPTNYRQSPYPVANAQGMRSAHGRSVSLATPSEFAFTQPNLSGSAHDSPVDNIKQEDRRMSMPVNPMPQTPLSGNAAPTSTHSSPARAISRNGSATNLAKQQQHIQPHTQQQPTPPSQADFANASPPGFQLRLPNNRNLDPLTTALPMESQQLLAANPYEFTFDNAPHMAQNNKQTYSYNPNGRPKSKNGSPIDYPAMPQMNMGGMGSMSSMGGMNATLAPSAFDTPSNYGTPGDNAFSPGGYAFGGMGYNNDMFTNDLLKEPLGAESGTVTPGEGDWAGFLTNDAWEEQPVA